MLRKTVLLKKKIMRAYERLYGDPGERVAPKVKIGGTGWIKSTRRPSTKSQSLLLTHLGRTKPGQIGFDLEDIDHEAYLRSEALLRARAQNAKLSRALELVSEGLAGAERKLMEASMGPATRGTRPDALGAGRLTASLARSLGRSLFSCIEESENRMAQLDELRSSEAWLTFQAQLAELRAMASAKEAIRRAKLGAAQRADLRARAMNEEISRRLEETKAKIKAGLREDERLEQLIRAFEVGEKEPPAHAKKAAALEELRRKTAELTALRGRRDALRAANAAARKRLQSRSSALSSRETQEGHTLSPSRRDGASPRLQREASSFSPTRSKGGSSVVRALFSYLRLFLQRRRLGNSLLTKLSVLRSGEDLSLVLCRDFSLSLPPGIDASVLLAELHSTKWPERSEAPRADSSLAGQKLFEALLAQTKASPARKGRNLDGSSLAELEEQLPVDRAPTPQPFKLPGESSSPSAKELQGNGKEYEAGEVKEGIQGDILKGETHGDTLNGDTLGGHNDTEPIGGTNQLQREANGDTQEDISVEETMEDTQEDRNEGPQPESGASAQVDTLKETNKGTQQEIQCETLRGIIAESLGGESLLRPNTDFPSPVNVSRMRFGAFEGDGSPVYPQNLSAFPWHERFSIDPAQLSSLLARSFDAKATRKVDDSLRTPLTPALRPRLGDAAAFSDSPHRGFELEGPEGVGTPQQLSPLHRGFELEGPEEVGTPQQLNTESLTPQVDFRISAMYLAPLVSPESLESSLSECRSEKEANRKKSRVLRPAKPPSRSEHSQVSYKQPSLLLAIKEELSD